MTPRARNIRAHLFTAGLYALVGDARGLVDQVFAAIELIAPNPWYEGGAGSGVWS